MSTITSPRAPSLASSLTPSSSRRTSLDTITSHSRPSSPARPHQSQPHQRRNRAALRDYYGLKSAPAAASEAESTGSHEDLDWKESELRELDREGFDAEGYVKEVLSKEGLVGILRVEGGLISGMWNRLRDDKQCKKLTRCG